jgi:histidinol dehydrogenase
VTVPLYRGAAIEAYLAEQTQGETEATESLAIQKAVSATLKAVAAGGDAALRQLAEQFGDPIPASLRLPESEIEAARNRLPAERLAVLETACKRIEQFAQGVVDGLKPVAIDHGEFSVGLTYRPVVRAGCYVPGGRYPLPSTALMTATTARVAGVQEIFLVSPRLSDEIIVAGALAGVTAFFQVGGAQAIAALAYGTETIPAVDVIVGPGNTYVTEAKRQVQGRVGIDMLAGPSEVAIIADGGANADWVTVDLLAQAEHDPMSRAYLITDSESLAEAVVSRLPALMDQLSLPAFMRESLPKSAVFIVENLDAAAALSNRVAPEHLQVNVAEPERVVAQLTDYGAVFIGYGATVPFGDYVAGPNHTLPTGRTARFSGTLTPLVFLRPQSWLRVPGKGGPLPDEAGRFADMEGLAAHAAAARIRVQP